MFAQLQSVDPVHIKDAAMVAIAAVGVVAMIWSMVRRPVHHIGPQPLDVREVKDAVTRAECDNLHAEQERRLAKLEADFRERTRENETSRARLYSHIDDVRKELSTKIDDQSKEFGQALRDLPSQVIAVLRNTGVIK